jgi:hypothetical protein
LSWVKDYGGIGRVKAQLRTWLAAAEFQKVVDASVEGRRTISTLIALTYDPDPLIRWRALDAIGRCAAHLCAIRPAALKDYLRRLFWTMSDESGAVAWHAPEAIGEIIRSDPPTFADFIPMAIALLDLEPEDRGPFLPGILYALGRIGEAAPDVMEKCLAGIIEALTADDPQARAMAVWSLGRLGAREALLLHPELAYDQCEALVYREERLVATTIESLWSEARARTASA